MTYGRNTRRQAKPEGTGRLAADDLHVLVHALTAMGCGIDARPRRGGARVEYGNPDGAVTACGRPFSSGPDLENPHPGDASWCRHVVASTPWTHVFNHRRAAPDTTGHTRATEVPSRSDAAVVFPRVRICDPDLFGILDRAMTVGRAAGKCRETGPSACRVVAGTCIDITAEVAVRRRADP
jgi:hypothetical protein